MSDSANDLANLEEGRTQSTGGVFSGSASHTSGSDTMAGISEMPSAMSVKSRKPSEDKAPSTPGSSSRDTTEFGKNGNSDSTSKFKNNESTPSPSQKKQDSDEDTDSDTTLKESDEGATGKVRTFASKKAQADKTEEAGETERPKRRGFRRDEFFQRTLEQFREADKPIILDRQYIDKHTEKPVDATYHKLHSKWEAEKQEKRDALNKDKRKDDDESNNDDENNDEETSDDDDRSSNNSTPRKKSSGFGGIQSSGLGGKKESEEENEESDAESENKEQEGTTDKAAKGFGAKKASKETDKPKRSKEQNDAVNLVKNFGKKPEDPPKETGSDDEPSSSDDDENKQKNTGRGFGKVKKSQPDGDDDEKEDSEEEDDNKSEILRITEELEQNRIYSGHICYELEDDEDLHGVNVPGEGLVKIESLEFKVSQGVEDGVKEIPKEHYVTNAFSDMTLHDQLAKNIRDYNWDKPLLVQRVAMRPISEGRDILVNAQTGSGKTGAFLIPIVNNILLNKREKRFAKEVERGERSDEIPGVGGIEGINPRALILVPTRELAIQIAREAVKLCRGLKKEIIKVCNLYGGTKRTTQRFEAFGADIIVGTPGRVGDILFPQVEGATKQNFVNCDYIVLDEADRMLDDGFGTTVLEIINRIEAKRGGNPITKVLASATFSADIQTYASAVLRPNYLYAQCGVLNAPCASVTQKAVIIENRKEKLSKLDEVLKEHNIGVENSVAKALIFGKTKKGVDFLGNKLSEKLGKSCITMHGDRGQVQREIALWTFSTSNCPVLVATNVAARGLDIPAVDLIVNFDCSDECYFKDDYIHRIGRAGRVGRPGTAVTFIEKERDGGNAPILKTLMEAGNAKVPEWLEEMATAAPDTDEEDRESEAASVSKSLASSRSSSVSNLSKSNPSTPRKKRSFGQSSPSVKGVRRDG